MGLSASAVDLATVYTRDRIQAVPVISQLDVADLEPGKTHRFMFRNAETSTTA